MHLTYGNWVKVGCDIDTGTWKCWVKKKEGQEKKEKLDLQARKPSFSLHENEIRRQMHWGWGWEEKERKKVWITYSSHRLGLKATFFRPLSFPFSHSLTPSNHPCISWRMEYEIQSITRLEPRENSIVYKRKKGRERERERRLERRCHKMWKKA